MSNFIGNNINAIRIDRGLSQEKIAEMTGISQTTISAWECGDSTPRKASVLKLLKAIPGITFDDVMSEHNGYATKVLAQSKPRKSDWVEVPFFGSIAAGEPIEMIDREDTYLIPASIAARHPNAGVLVTRGNSWNKEIPDGYYIVVDFDIKNPSNDREPFAVCIDGETATVKSIQKLENGIRLLPNSYDETIRPIVFDYAKDGESVVTTLGKVVWAFAPFDCCF